jgi:hypothetical protein
VNSTQSKKQILTQYLINYHTKVKNSQKPLLPKLLLFKPLTAIPAVQTLLTPTVFLFKTVTPTLLLSKPLIPIFLQLKPSILTPAVPT